MGEAIDIALDKNPQLIAVELQIDAAGQARRGARAGFFPTVDLAGEANYEKDKNATVGTRRDYSVLLKAT